LESNLTEKDKIIKIVYLEIDELRKQIKDNSINHNSLNFSTANKNQINDNNSNIKNKEIEQFNSSNLIPESIDGLNLVKKALLEYFNSFNIDIAKDMIGIFNNFETKKPSDSLISLIKEIHLLVVNLKKITISFKSTCKNISETLFKKFEILINVNVSDKLIKPYNKINSLRKKLASIGTMRNK